MTRLLALLLILALGGPPSSAPQPAQMPQPAAPVAGGHEDVVPASVASGLAPAQRAGTPTPPATGTRPAPTGDAPDRSPLRGTASWYAADGLIAAAGPALRRELGKGWRGTRVAVCAERCVTVLVSDWCQCYRETSRERLIDLSDDAFRRLAPLSSGLVRVRVWVLGGIGLPETDR